MLVAMGIASALCIAIGVWPEALYRFLPFAVTFEPYTTTHVVTQFQLLFFSAAAFVFLQKAKIYPPELPSINLDVDWLYRRMLPAGLRVAEGVMTRSSDALRAATLRWIAASVAQVRVLHAPAGLLGEPWSIGRATLWAAVLLVVCLVVAWW